MKKTIVTIWMFIATGCVFAQQKILPRDQAAVLEVLSTQEKAWNDGDLDRFMTGYWQNEALLFVGRSGPTLGYAQTLANYHKAYPNKAAMGELHFDILHLTQWDAQTIQLIGKVTLKRAEDSPSGFFTLLFRKINGQWKIVSDHTS